MIDGSDQRLPITKATHRRHRGVERRRFGVGKAMHRLFAGEGLRRPEPALAGTAAPEIGQCPFPETAGVGGALAAQVEVAIALVAELPEIRVAGS